MKKDKLKSVYFIKAICAIGIIIFHFSCRLENTSFLPFYKFLNGDWGSVFVTVFFMVSGGMLYYNYSDKLNIVSYYIKRWKSIFPMFYIIYLFFEIQYMIINGSIFYRGNPIFYVFTFLGMDGYFNSIVPTYYILGEWFLGMILILYVLFPLVLYFFRKNDKFTFGVVLLLYIIFLDRPILNPVSYWSITSSLFSFVVGMMILKYRNIFLNKNTLFIASVGILVLNIIKLPFSFDISNHLLGIFVFVFLFEVGKYFMKNKVINIIFMKLGELSYAIFLLQHITIVNVLRNFNPISIGEVLSVLLITIIFVLCEANVLFIVTNFIVNKVGIFLEKYI